MKSWAAFGRPLQAAVDRLPPENAPLQFAALLVAAVATLGCYALAVWLGEGRRASELALRPALPGIAIGAALGLLMSKAASIRPNPDCGNNPA